MFLLPHVLGILEREPLAEDLVVFGNGPDAGGLGPTARQRLYPPLVSQDAALERVIANVAQDHHRPFNFESPRVDVQLSPRLRFHGQGFDIVSRPAIFIRVHRSWAPTFADMFEAGHDVGRASPTCWPVVPEAGLSVACHRGAGLGQDDGPAGDRCWPIPPDTRMVTVETDFEFGLAGLGRPWTQEMQARLPVTSKDRGITCGDSDAPELRTRAEVIIDR